MARLVVHICLEICRIGSSRSVFANHIQRIALVTSSKLSGVPPSVKENFKIRSSLFMYVFHAMNMQLQVKNYKLEIFKGAL